MPTSYAPEERAAGWARRRGTADSLEADAAEHVPLGTLPNCTSARAYVFQAHDALERRILVSTHWPSRMADGRATEHPVPRYSICDFVSSQQVSTQLTEPVRRTHAGVRLVCLRQVCQACRAPSKPHIHSFSFSLPALLACNSAPKTNPAKLTSAGRRLRVGVLCCACADDVFGPGALHAAHHPDGPRQR